MSQTLNNQELVDLLRRLADVYESHPDICIPFYLGRDPLAIYCQEDWGNDAPEATASARFARTVRAFGGGPKDATETTLVFRPEAFPNVEIRAFKSDVCERVVKGKRVVPAEPERTEVYAAVPEHEEEIVEWHCRPFTEAK